jgi:hypothetical protein
MVTTILSPHLDDAVLSCWHVLAQPGDVTVINVFAGAPAPDGAPAWWDELTGATDSSRRVGERVEEDRTALALAGRTPVNLGFLDEQYRDVEQPLEPLVAQLERHLVKDVHIYAPAALADHVDHALVRGAALQLRGAGFAVTLYADLPHAVRHGMPAWVTGGHRGESHDVATALWDRSLVGTGISPASMASAVHELDVRAHARKLEAVRAYHTQLQGLAEFAGRPLTDHETLGYEVVWTLPVIAASLPARGRRRVAPRL